MGSEGTALGLYKEKSQSQPTDFSTSLFIWPVLICILYNKTLIINITLFQVLCFIIDHCQTQVIPGSLICVVRQKYQWPWDSQRPSSIWNEGRPVVKHVLQLVQSVNSSECLVLELNCSITVVRINIICWAKCELITAKQGIGRTILPLSFSTYVGREA